jgi:hypothetical protein
MRNLKMHYLKYLKNNTIMQDMKNLESITEEESKMNNGTPAGNQ